MFNEASLSTIRLLIRIFYISKRRNFLKNLTFNCEAKIALDIEGQKRIIIIIDCYAIHEDIQSIVDSFQFINMFSHSTSNSNED
jgi:hypothetical protein